MKKVLIIIAILLLIGLGLFFFLGGKGPVSEFFNRDADFGSFFDTQQQSRNDFVPLVPITATTTPVTDGPYVPPVLRQISFEPVSGYTHYATSSTSTRSIFNDDGVEVLEEFTATSTAIRFQERGSGHVYDVFEFTPIPEKVSNITVQKSYNSFFANNPAQFIFSTPTFNNEQIRSTFAQIIPATEETETASSTPQTLEQKDISTAVTDMMYLPATNQIIFSIKKIGGSEVYVSDLMRENERLLITLPFREFTISPLSDTHVLIQTSAARNSPGYAYSLRLSNGVLSKLIGGVPGLLTKVSADQQYILYSESGMSRPIIRVLNKTTGELKQLGIETIPEKCVFSKVVAEELYCFGAPIYKPGIYPDDWYKGKIFNSEELYKINLSNGLIDTLYVFEEEDPDFDVINPQITQADAHITFQNKYDLTLWSLNLERLVTQFY